MRPTTAVTSADRERARVAFRIGTVSASPTHDVRTRSSAARISGSVDTGGRTRRVRSTSSATAPPKAAATRADSSACSTSSTTKSPAAAIRSMGAPAAQRHDAISANAAALACSLKALSVHTQRAEAASSGDAPAAASPHGMASKPARRRRRRRAHGPPASSSSKRLTAEPSSPPAPSRRTSSAGSARPSS